MASISKITISGDLGSGKSSVAKVVCNTIPYKYISTGQIHRQIAEELQMDAYELNIYAETHPEIDQRIDSVLIELNDDRSNWLVDSRMAWHLIHRSLKIYLKVDKEVGTERILKDTSRFNEPQYVGKTNALNTVIARKNSERRRFLKTYGVDCDDLENYDVVIDTTFATKENVIDLLLLIINQWVSTDITHKYWVSPRTLFPSEHVRSLASPEAHRVKKDMAEKGYDYSCPISVVQNRGHYFIWDGHKRTSAALHNKLPFVPLAIVNKPKQELKDPYLASIDNSISLYYDWEELHKFTFADYPKN